MTKKELTEMARKRGVKGYKTMSREELELALKIETPATVVAGAAGRSPDTKAAHPLKAPSVPDLATTEATAPTLESKVPARDKTRRETPALAAPAATPLLAPATPQTAPAPAASSVATEPAIAAPSVSTDLVPAEAQATNEPKTLSTEPTAPGAPKVVPLKQTWTNQALLIDDEIEPLPAPHPRDRAVLLVRDPFWIYTYWDLSPQSVREAKAQGGVKLTMRVHDVSDLTFDGSNSHLHFDLPMPDDSQRVWYLNVPTDGRSYLVEVGYTHRNGTFQCVARSNHGTTPRARLSEVISDRFVALDFNAPIEETAPPSPSARHGAAAAPASPTEPQAVAPQAPKAIAPPSLPVPTPMPDAPRGVDISEQMYHLSLQGTRYWSADVPKYGDARGYRGATSSEGFLPGAPSSAEFQRPASGPGATDKDFWLVADCELIVYGATEPDARVTVRGQGVELRPDGTFTLRFALPDGIHPIPIHGTNADGDMHRSLTITVSRGTTVGS